MNREELAGSLKEDYDQQRGYGVAKVLEPGYENIWFVVPPPPPRELPDRLPLSAMGRANDVLSRLPSCSEMSEVDKLISYFFIRREAVESSRLEGTWSTIDHLLTPPEVQGDRQDRDGHGSVRGYAHALEKQIQNARALKEGVFTRDTLCEIHKDIVSKDPAFRGVPGELRAPGRPGSVVQIGGVYRKEESTYNPAPPVHVSPALDKVLSWLGDRELAQRGDAGVSGFTLPVRLALGHAHFEAVHPFTDGNGRVGRALWPLQMICADRMPLYLSGFVEQQKQEYSRSLQQAQKKLDCVPMIEFLCEAICRSDSEAASTRAAIESLPGRWKARAKFRGKSAALSALEVLVRKPLLTAAVLMEELGLSKQVAGAALKQLVARQVVRLRGRTGRTRVYAAEELIALLSRPFGSDPGGALEQGQRSILVG